MPIKHLIAVAIIIITVSTVDYIHTAFVHDSHIYREQSKCIAEFISLDVKRNNIITYTFKDHGYCTSI